MRRVSAVPPRPGELALGADTAGAPAAPCVDGDLVVDRRAHRATRDGSPRPSPAREFDLLAHLAGNPAFTRRDLLKEVWGREYADDSTVTVHVRRLREKSRTTRPDRSGW